MSTLVPILNLNPQQNRQGTPDLVPRQPFLYWDRRCRQGRNAILRRDGFPTWNWPRNCKNGCVGNPNRMRIQPQPQPLARPVASLIRPETSYDLADSFNSWVLPPAPEPVRFPRKALQMKFAVLLMRSAYESVDALDFIPMDKFQEKFWKLRQSEVEPYTLQNRPVPIRYGDLTDPLYFDFISFAQFATISNQMRTGEMVFKERIGSDGAVQVVKRDDRLKDNTKLPSAFRSQAGNAIYQKLLEGFEGQGFSVPPPCPQRSSFFCAVEGVQKLMQAFVQEGYALRATVDQVQPAKDNNGGTLRVKVDGSATLWGIRALVSRRALVLPNFESLAVGGFLQASRWNASSKVRYSDTSVDEFWTLA